MKQKVYSVLVIIVFAVCLFLFFTLYRSSLMFEEMRALVNDKDKESGVSLVSMQPAEEVSYFFDTYIQNPATLELYLKSSIVNSEKNNNNVGLMYKRLLRTRPTWPYYYSGLAQYNQILDQFIPEIIYKTIKYGKHEKKVVHSLAEILFHNWKLIKTKDRELIMSHFLGQQDKIISQTVSISSKFAKFYEYCDFIYEKKHVEYAACTGNYWQPLSD